MRIRALYFHAVRDRVGAGEETWDLEPGASVADLTRRLTQRHPELEKMRSSLLFAVNEEHASPDRRLNDGDVVAVMPPFSGG